MDLRIQKSDLLRCLYLTHGIADRKSTVPILANVLIRTEGKGRVMVASTDLKVAMMVSGPATVVEEGGITVAARQIYEIVKGLGGAEVRLERTEQNWLIVQSGRSEFKVVGMSDRDFPKLPSFGEKPLEKVSPAVLSEMIGKTIVSVSQDETRPHLASVLLESDGEKATMVSTDGHRLSKIGRAMAGGPSVLPGVLIPRKGILEVRRALEGKEEPVEVGVEEGYLVVKAGEMLLSVKLGEGQFPPYEQVIPKDNDKKVVLVRDEFLESLKRVSIIASDKTWGIRFTLEKNQLSIDVDNPDLGVARETLDVEYKGDRLQIGFNARYFIDLLSEMTGKEVRLELGGDLDPALVVPSDGSDYLGVIMPMRL